MDRKPCSDNTTAFENVVGLNIPLHLKNTYDNRKRYYVKIGKFYYKLENSPDMTKNQIMMNLYQRRETSIDDTKKIIIEEYDKLIAKSAKLSKINIEISLHKPKQSV